MSEFTFLFRGRETFESPEQAQKHMAQWTAWFKELEKRGSLKDPGHPLEKAGKVVSGSKNPECRRLGEGTTGPDAQPLNGAQRPSLPARVGPHRRCPDPYLRGP